MESRIICSFRSSGLCQARVKTSVKLCLVLCGASDQTQGFVDVRRALCHLSHNSILWLLPLFLSFSSGAPNLQTWLLTHFTRHGFESIYARKRSWLIWTFTFPRCRIRYFEKSLLFLTENNIKEKEKGQQSWALGVGESFM